MNSGLEFTFSEFRQEIRVMTDLAKHLLTRESIGLLQKFEERVRQLGERPTDRPYELEFAGVRTLPSDGEYETVGRKGKTIAAELSSTWRVKPIGASGKKRPRRRFQLTDLASTRVAIHDHSNKVLACWHMDVADEKSPGCYFHIQIAQDRDESPFPAWLPVPRFPNLLVTPMATLEFVLGELFQDRWLQRTSRNGYHAPRWRSIQKKRWQHILSWHLEHLRETEETCSPWMSIKTAQPPADLFSGRS